MTLDPFAEIVFTRHVLERMGELAGLGPDDLPAVRGELRSAILAGRVAERTPNWARGRTKKTAPRPGCRYLWNPDATRCWVVAVYRGGRRLNVVTLRLERDEREAHNDRKLVRAGMVRA